MPAMRLDKLIAGAGAATRSEAKKLIRAGRVTVDGRPAADPAAHCDTTSEVRLDGERVVWQEYLYLMLNKPAGYLSVTEDPKAPTVLELLPPELRRRNLSPAGRLDKDSEGLLILTSDGDFCHRVISPRSGIEKEYYIEVDRPFPQGAEALFSSGERWWSVPREEDIAACRAAGVPIVNYGILLATANGIRVRPGSCLAEPVA